jgi:SAM-dependent MidA family methyltransferase
MENQQVTNVELLNEIKKLQAQILTMGQNISNLEQRVDNTNGVLINHIGFINNVFDTIKRPLFFLMNKVNGLLLLENSN